MSKVQFYIYWGESFVGAERQDKTFNSMENAMIWLARNHKKVQQINECPTYGNRISHFEILDAIRN